MFLYLVDSSPSTANECTFLSWISKRLLTILHRGSLTSCHIHLPVPDSISHLGLISPLFDVPELPRPQMLFSQLMHSHLPSLPPTPWPPPSCRCRHERDSGTANLFPGPSTARRGGLTHSNEILHTHERCLAGKLRRVVKGFEPASSRRGEAGRDREREGKDAEKYQKNAGGERWMRR